MLHEPTRKPTSRGMPQVAQQLPWLDESVASWCTWLGLRPLRSYALGWSIAGLAPKSRAERDKENQQLLSPHLLLLPEGHIQMSGGRLRCALHGRKPGSPGLLAVVFSCVGHTMIRMTTRER